MSRAGAWARLVARALTSVVLGVGLAACTSPDRVEVRPPAPPAVTAPLDVTYATASSTVAVVAMGLLEDPLNTFWELFSRSGPTSAWALVTPPGVADNGGLVVGSGSSLLAGFEPSQELEFSPLAASADQGASWSPGLVPGALSAVPDALAAPSSAGLVALVRNGGGEVLSSGGDPSTWSELVGRGEIAASSAGRSCGVGELTAVTLDATRGALVGTTCTTPGVVGIFDRVAGAWHLAGGRLPASTSGSTTKVLRLVDVDGAPDALVAVGDSASPELFALDTPSRAVPSGAWSSSPALSIPPGSRLVSTGVAPDGGFVVLTSATGRPLALDVESGRGGAWQALPSPPEGTAAVAVSAAGEVDALVAAATVLIDWRLDTATATWSKIATVTVPIQFGSSS